MHDSKELNLEKDLLKALEISEQRIALLNTIRSRPDKRATLDEYQWLNQHRMPVLSDNIITLMLEAKADKRREKGQYYQPFLILKDDSSAYEFQYKLSELIDQKQAFHYDCIIKNGAHCTPVQVEFDGENFRIFYLDASGDKINLQFSQLFFEEVTDTPSFFYSYLGGAIQRDRSSCSVFSLQHLNNLSNADLAQKKGINHSSYELLDPVFLKNIQTTELLHDYYQKNKNATIDKKSQKTLQAHIENYSITVDVAEMTMWDRLSFYRKSKTQNHAIAYKTHKYLLAAQHKLEQIKRENTSLTTVLTARKSCLNKNIATRETDSNIGLRMLQSWVKNADLERIKEYIFFAIDPNNDAILKNLLNLGIGTTLTEVLIWLKSQNMDLNTVRNGDGNTLMTCAAHLGLIETMNTLHAMGLSLKEPRLGGMTPLTVAIENRQWGIVRRMQELGLNVNEFNEQGVKLAMILAIKGIRDVEKIQEFGVDFDIVDPNGVTPAFLAAQHGHLNIVSFLLDSPTYHEVPFRTTKESLITFARGFDTQVQKRMDDFILSQSYSQSQIIEMLPEDIALVMGHTDIVEFINTKRMQLLQSIGTSTEEYIARTLLFDLRNFAKNCLNSDSHDLTQFLSTVQKTKKQINTLILPPKSRALFQLLITDIEKEIKTIAPYHQTLFQIVAFVAKISRIFGDGMSALIRKKSTTTPYKKSSENEDQVSYFSSVNKK